MVSPVIVRTGTRNYEVVIGPGILEQAGRLISHKLKGTECALVTDDNVSALFAEKVSRSLNDVGFRPILIKVRPGEQSKTTVQAEAICRRMIEAGLDRSSFVVALGGGMVGDLAGFAAAIYHRGIPCVQIPTTLLAQVDSSIGGKTAVNTTAGKNLLGAWHQPTLVISDVDTLATLPPREWRQGWAEVVKHALIRDAEMFETLQQYDRKELAPLVRRNVEIKAAIVSADEHETTGERALLNFGHTIGHAIERAGEYRDFLHGDAVSLGLVAACEISVRKGGLQEPDREKIIRTLRAFELPTTLPPDFPQEKILEAIPFDKKFTQGAVRFVVLSAIGSAHLETDVTMDDIAAAVRNL